MTVKRLLIGGLAGLTATVPMTLFMLAVFRRLPPDERYALPQQEIVDAGTGAMGTHDDRDAAPLPTPAPETASLREALATAAHFGYGAASGAVYAACAPAGADRPAARGVVFGLLLWAASYLGWLPALGVLTPATRHPPRRSAMMIAAHLVWGSIAGTLVHRWGG